MNRKKFNETILMSLAAFSLLERVFQLDAFARKISPITDLWYANLNAYCRDLKKSAITSKEWQELTGELLRKVSLTELMRFIDFERVRDSFEFPDLGVSTQKVFFPSFAEIPENSTIVKKLFGMRADRAIIPHGHSNMASAHLVLEGELRLRQYEQISRDADSMEILPSVDRKIGPGSVSSISDDHHNVHWFIAESAHAFTFDIIVLDLDEKPYNIYNLDIDNAEKQGSGSMRVPILSVQEALRKYGKELDHH